MTLLTPDLSNLLSRNQFCPQASHFLPRLASYLQEQSEREGVVLGRRARAARQVHQGAFRDRSLVTQSDGGERHVLLHSCTKSAQNRKF